MGYTVTVDIKSSDFPGLGNPAYPKEYASVKDTLPKEVKNKVKDQYESYYRNATKASSSIIGEVDFKSALNKDELCVQLDYEEGIPKTYKFLGMDIDDNYTAVILLGDGFVKVAPMFSINDIASAKVSSYAESSIIQIATDTIKSSSADLARTLSTAMKTGALYDLFRGLSTNFDPISGKDQEVKSEISDVRRIRLENFEPLVRLVRSKIGSNSDGSGSGTTFKSVLLNLVDREKRKDQESMYKDSGNTGDMDMTVAAIILSKIFKYWEGVISKYNSYNSLLSELDLWSSLGKACMGESAFNAQMRSTGMVIQNNDTGEIINEKIISFAGVSKDGGINDANMYRTASASSLSNFGNVLSGYSSSVEVSLQDIMIGNIDYVDFGNPFELSAEELQAVSSYDSLKYVDEDAKSCRESYNMNDPEERSQFIKSAIKSYDRNFRTFKSAHDYDVAQAFSDMVERGVTFSDRIVPKDIAGEGDLENYEVTSSQYAIDRAAIKKSLVKVGKLLNKSLSDVYDLFNTSSQTTNP